MAIKLRSFTAAFRKPMLKAFGLFSSDEDLSFIESYSAPPSVSDLSASITSGENQDFELETLVSTDTVMFLWNGQWLKENVGFTRSGTTLTMATGFVPKSGDSLVAYVWGIN